MTFCSHDQDPKFTQDEAAKASGDENDRKRRAADTAAAVSVDLRRLCDVRKVVSRAKKQLDSVGTSNSSHTYAILA